MTARSSLSPLLADLLYARDNRLLDDPLGQKLGQAIRLGLGNKFVIDTLQSRVERHRIAQAFAGPFMSPPEFVGDIVHGVTPNGRHVRAPLQYSAAHTLVVGGSGSGKTWLARSLVLEVAPHIDGLWLLDLAKNEFRLVSEPLAKVGIQLFVVDVRSELRFNPLAVPEHVSPDSWAIQLSDMLSSALRLPERASMLVQARLMTLYRHFGVKDHTDEFPTLFDLMRAVRDDREANPQAREALLGRLGNTLLSIGDIVDWSRGWTAEALSRRRVVFEFGGLAELEKSLLLTTMLGSLFSSRVSRGDSNRPMDLMVICDEAQRLAMSEGAGGLNALIGLVRGTGVGLHLSTQSSVVSRSILSNSATKLIGRVGSAADMQEIGSSIGLTQEQQRWMVHHLIPGMFVCQFGEGPWRHPFVLHGPPLPAFDRNFIPPSITDATLGITTQKGRARAGEVTAIIRPVRALLPPSVESLSDAEMRYLQVVL